MKKFVMLGAINAFLAVALGAFGAHALEKIVDPSSLGTWETAVQYQMLHAGGLLVIGLLLGKLPNNRLLTISGWVMLAGIILFSGSLYALTLTGVKMLGAITPIGGVAFLTAWTLVAIVSYKKL